MTTQSVVLAPHPKSAPITKSRILIIADEPKTARHLQAELSFANVEITSIATSEELREACRSGHDLVIVNVAPAKVLDVLQQLRDRDGYQEISVLVDASRLAMEPSLAGVLPSFRAMPCSAEELLRLARRKLKAAPSTQNIRSYHRPML